MNTPEHLEPSFRCPRAPQYWEAVKIKPDSYHELFLTASLQGYQTESYFIIP